MAKLEPDRLWTATLLQVKILDKQAKTSFQVHNVREGQTTQGDAQSTEGIQMN